MHRNLQDLDGADDRTGRAGVIRFRTGAVAAVAVVSVLIASGCSSGKSGSGVSSGAGGGDVGVTATPGSTSGGPASTSGSGGSSAAPSTASSAAPSTASSPAGAADRSQCAGVDAKMVPLPGAASGTTFADLVVVNHGKTICTLPAQPKLEYLSANHKELPVVFESNPDLTTYKLVPGASAAMAIAYSGTTDPPCNGKVAYARVTPPGDDLPLDGRINCAQDTTYEEGWVAGTYAAPH